MSFDFATVKATDEARTLVVRHPNTNAVIAEIDLVSINADRPTEVQRRFDKKILRDANRLNKLDPDEIESSQLDVLAACTVAWRGADGGDILWGGEPLPCNHINARKLYAEVKWLREEVSRFVKEVANFLEPSPLSSVSSSEPSSV